MIGGEFDIELSKMEQMNAFALAPNEYAYSSGRAALYQILNHIKQSFCVKTILLPEYLCESIVETVKKTSLPYSFYAIDEQLSLEENSLSEVYKINSSILIINYFGLVDIERQKQYIKSHYPDAIIIEDDVHAYYEYIKPLGVEDYKFTSLRKWFAVPDGGLVKSKYSLPEVIRPNNFTPFKLTGAILKDQRTVLQNDKLYLSLFEKGEELLKNDYNSGMSNIAKCLYAAMDIEAVRQQREKNARVLLQGLKDISSAQLMMSVNEQKVPLFIPVTLPNRDAVRKRFFETDMFMPIHWPNQQTTHARQISQSELSLIIDQRYTESDMMRIVEILSEK